MKKNIVFMLAAVLLTAMFAGCSGAPGETDSENITGETFDGGNISALVPDGWMGFHGVDFFEEYEEGYDPNVIQIAKGAESEGDLFFSPYVMINYYAPDNPMMEPMKELYEDAADLEPVTIGGLYLERIYRNKPRYSYRSSLDRRTRIRSDTGYAMP